jgi:hypothetical protein
VTNHVFARQISVTDRNSKTAVLQIDTFLPWKCALNVANSNFNLNDCNLNLFARHQGHSLIIRDFPNFARRAGVNKVAISRKPFNLLAGKIKQPFSMPPPIIEKAAAGQKNSQTVEVVTK